MELIQSKSLLAKLMATENLTIEQRKVQTASFDVENRILTVPVLDNNISSFLYDLFMGHEVGHALYTPADGMKKAYEMKLSKSIMNVLEDVRIEKKIKTKYPGIRQSFLKGYNELIEKDFFNTLGTDLNLMNFIDRLNLYSKGGTSLGIKFSEKEKQLVREAESTESYDDVITLCKKVMDHIKEEKEKNKQQSKEEYDDEEESFKSDSGMDDWNDYDDFGDESELENETEDTEGTGEETPKDPEETVPGKQNSNLTDAKGESSITDDEEEIRSFTDEAFRKNEERLHSNVNYRYGNIPDVNLDQAIVEYKYFWNRYKSDYNTKKNEFSDAYGKTVHAQFFTECESRSKENFIKLRKDSNRAVSYLTKEFELRKNADQMKRASVAKTGELNLNKIHNYKFSEDIFKKITVIPGGKSHGLVMFLDWSGSMSEYMGDTIKQLYNLVAFCRKVSIPFEVYAFTDNYFNDNEDYLERARKQSWNVTEKDGDIGLDRFTLMNIFSSKMSASEFSYAAEHLLKFGNRDHTGTPRWMDLGGTPLNETIIAAMKIVPKFQKENKLQIVNTVILTDGEGSRTDRVLGEDSMVRYTSSKLVVRDPVTKHQEVFWSADHRKMTAGYIKLLKARTQSNVLGFYVLSSYTFKSKVYDFFGIGINHDAIKSQFRNEKYLTLKSEGYDEYYLLNSKGMEIEEDAELVVEENATKRKLLTAFTKYAGKRNTSRVVLNRFIGMIA